VSNDFENIQKLYEEGYRGLSYDQGPNAKYDTAAAPRGYSYRKGGMPTGYPGAGGYSAYNAGQAGSYGVGTAAIISGDEEVEAAEIINLDVLDKLNELIDESNEAEMDYAVLQLSKLREHIISLSQGKLD
jgi:hypothetical protein|tara:strand:+ start:2753 stop:3142 length:390 start_codon:yes stop_codon:yes gene_type:complete